MELLSSRRTAWRCGRSRRPGGVRLSHPQRGFGSRPNSRRAPVPRLAESRRGDGEISARTSRSPSGWVIARKGLDPSGSRVLESAQAPGASRSGGRARWPAGPLRQERWRGVWRVRRSAAPHGCHDDRYRHRGHSRPGRLLRRAAHRPARRGRPHQRQREGHHGPGEHGGEDLDDRLRAAGHRPAGRARQLGRGCGVGGRARRPRLLRRGRRARRPLGRGPHVHRRRPQGPGQPGQGGPRMPGSARGHALRRRLRHVRCAAGLPAHRATSTASGCRTATGSSRRWSSGSARPSPCARRASSRATTTCSRGT